MKLGKMIDVSGLGFQGSSPAFCFRNASSSGFCQTNGQMLLLGGEPELVFWDS